MIQEHHEPGVARRRLLKAVTVGMGGTALLNELPSRWTRPVVESALLPAHAQATGDAAAVSFQITSCDIISTASTGPDSVDINFTFTLFRSDGQPFPSGITMDVDFTFSPSGTTVASAGDGFGSFTLDSSNTYSAIESLSGTGIGNDSTVEMTVGFAITGLVEPGDAPPCTAGPEPIILL